MEKHELRAATSLAAVFSVRMLGLFMVYPVFAGFARHLPGATAVFPFAAAVAIVWLLVAAGMRSPALGYDGARLTIMDRKSADR